MVNLLKDQKIKRRKHIGIQANAFRFSIEKAVYGIRFKLRSSSFGQTLLAFGAKTKSVVVTTLSLLVIGVFIFAGIQLSRGDGLPEPRTFEISFADGLPGSPTVEMSDESGLFQSGGAGIPAVDREKDIQHIVQQGETLSEIAYYYNIDLEKLAIYNGVTNPDSIRLGYELRIPSYANEKNLVKREVLQNTQLSVEDTLQTANVDSPVPNLSITAQEINKANTSVTVRLSVDPDEAENFTYFEWHLGNGETSKVKTAIHTYSRPGTYKVYLKVRDLSGRTIQSNHIYVDVPFPSTYQSPGVEFVTLNKVGESFTIEGQIIEIKRYSEMNDVVEYVGSIDDEYYEYTALKTGYFDVVVEKDGYIQNLYLFVSPIPSVHSESKALNWYRSQFNTGTMGNCGPTTVSMSVGWATGEYVPVINVRQMVGWQNEGATSFADLRSSLRNYGVDARQKRVGSVNDITNIIDNGNIAIILINTGGVSVAKGNPAYDLFGLFYTCDPVGHYVVIKGYSENKKWFIVHDPMPSDWGGNTARYADGVSMLGRNRYYSSYELFNAMKLWEVLEIVR